MKYQLLLLSMIIASTLFTNIWNCSSVSQVVQNRKLILSGAKATFKLSQFYSAYAREFTPAEEYYIGRAVAGTLLSKYKLYGNGSTPLEQYITKIGYTLTMSSNRPETFQDYRFIVVNSPAINALACPSGYIFITTGIINLAANEDELAGILAHEVTHIALKHPLSAISEAQKGEAITELLSSGAEMALSSAQGLDKLTKMFDGVVNGVSNIILTGYSQDKEQEADKSAVSILMNAGYNPEGLAKILSKLQNRNDVIHGDPKIRSKNVEDEIEKVYFVSGTVRYYQASRDQRFNQVINKANFIANK